ncbi:argininosuccinate lyase [Campylobacterota bacterium]|nr:argininosuccinate lyase [Campylobacterota bacterium]
MSGKLWGGRFSEASSALLEAFNASIGFDHELYREDIAGSIAHARMLSKTGIISAEDFAAIERGLTQIKEEIESGNFAFEIADEDIHMAVEKRLTALIGEAGKRVHTARSRNDQVALDFRLWCLRKNYEIADLLIALMDTLVSIAENHTQTIMPGMTHLQHAQPVSFAFHLLAYAAMFRRDYERFTQSAKRNNISPIGSAALAGTPHPIDRAQTAAELGFDGVSINAMDSVSDRDFALELLFNISAAMMHFSRLCEELVLWSSSEFRFITISDQFSTGSSIMPQKKNPDVAELIRGKTGRVYGNLIGLLTVMKGLPLAYNKDMQEDKEGVLDSVVSIINSLKILEAMIKSMTINSGAMLNAAKKGHLTATDLADQLVQKGVAFRDAHEITGRAVALAEQKGVDLSELGYDELRTVDDRIDHAMLAHLSLFNSMNARNSEGGTAEVQVHKQIAFFKRWLHAKHY